MKITTYATARAYCVAYLDLLAKISETVEVVRDCHQMSGSIIEAEAYKKAATDILRDIAELTVDDILANVGVGGSK